MKKNETGFTLVELLAVIVILAIVLIIAVPGVLSIINKTKQNGYESQLKMIKEGARNYVTSESSSIVWKDGKATITLKSLQDNGYLEKKIIDPRNKKEISCVSVLVTKDSKNKVSYQVDDDTCKPTPETCFTFDALTNTITGYDVTCGTEVIIPSKIGGVVVKNIGTSTTNSPPFSSKGLTSVVIPNSVTMIGEAAFGGNQLTSVVIPNSVTTVGEIAFASNQLTSVVISEGVKRIERGAFIGNQLTSVTLPNSVTTIGNGAFNQNQLTSLVIPGSVTSIEGSAFMNNQIKTVTLPKSLTAIGEMSFNYNQLSDDQAFIYARNADGTEDKTNLVSYGGANRGTVVIPDGVVTIGTGCVSGYKLDNLIIPASVATLGTNAIGFNRKVTIRGKTSTSEFINSGSAGWSSVNQIIFET